ncbi:MAG: glycosyltransferase family 9 protein [Spirochaetia bacterium]|jgi:ADP-heptose:LPS heptosyltransferase
MEKKPTSRPGRAPSASLLYHAGALGDFITALPAMLVWRRLHPGAHIVLLGRPDHAVLAGDPAPFDEVWDAGSALFAPLFSAGGAQSGLLRERFSAFTSALLFSGASSPLAGNIAAAGTSGITRQDPFPRERIPIVDYHLSLFPREALVPEDRFPRLRTSDTPLSAPPSAVFLHPGSGGSGKNWPLERFGELARRLQGRGLTVVWIAGPAEEGVALPDGAECWRSAPLSALAASLGRAWLYVGNDSGITHLAAASGCPTIALFGASDAAVWTPRGPRVVVIERPAGGMNAITVDDVFGECRKLPGGEKLR